MGLWDDVKSFFGFEKPSSAEDRLAEAVGDAMEDRMEKHQAFSWVNIADAVRVVFPDATSMDVARLVNEWVEDGFLDEYDYVKTVQHHGGQKVVVFHHGGSLPTLPAPAAPAPSESSGPSAGTSKAGKKKSKKPKNPWAAGDLVSLSKAELRARALKITPWRTAWIGRVDVIPPLSDERTALVDRGLVLRGFFTDDEIEEIHRVGDLWLEHKEALKLAKAAAAKNADAALEQLREEKRKRKAERKAEAKRKREEHEKAVARRKATDIIFLGRGVSEKLGDRRANVEKLEGAGLPVLASPADVARALDVPIPKLRWLAFHDGASPAGHYVQFEVEKRSGGKRLLSAPKTDLRAAHRWIFEQILSKLEVEPEAHGFVAGRSTVTNATPHQGRDVILNIDLEAFFPSITFPRVRGLFASLGYSPAAATVLALLTTEAPRREVRYAGKPYQVAVGPRGLPQGACTSPALSNQIAKKLDRRLAGLANKHGWTYTRYADDLTFSAPPGKRGELGRMLAFVRHVVTEEGFRINEKKLRVQRKGGAQKVTGIVVNHPEQLGLPRKELRQLRALLHNAKKTGLAAQNRAKRPHFEAYLRGKIAYVSMVHPERGAELKAALDGVLGS